MNSQADRKYRAVYAAGHIDGPAVHIYDIFCDRQAKPRSSGASAAGMLYPVKFIKYQRQLVRRYHVSVIDHRYCNRLFFCVDLYHYPLAVRSVFDSVIDQIVKQSGQKIAVRCDDLCWNVGLELIRKVLIRKTGIKFFQKLA